MSIHFSASLQTPSRSNTKAPATALPSLDSNSMAPALPSWYQLQQGQKTPLGTSAPPKMPQPSAEDIFHQQEPSRSGVQSSADKRAKHSGDQRIGKIVNVSAADVTNIADSAKALLPHKASQVDLILERVRQHIELHPTQAANIHDTAVQDLRKLMQHG